MAGQPPTLAVALNLPSAAPARPLPLALAYRCGRFCRQRPLGAAGLAIIGLLLVLVLFAPQLRRYHPEETFSRPNPFYNPASFEPRALQPVTLDALASPSRAHWLGTDNAGRDSYSRVVTGSRRALGLGVGALLLGTLMGLALGLVSAHFGGRLDLVLQRLLDALQSFPPLLLLLLLITLAEPSLRLVLVGIAVASVPYLSRIVRGMVLQTREQPFVEAARVLGAGDGRIIIRHLLPNVLPATLVVFSIGVGSAILAEASLSFLGLAPPGVSWGSDLAAGISYQRTSPWPAICAGGAIALAVFGFNSAGDGLRDALDPKQRE